MKRVAVILIMILTAVGIFFLTAGSSDSDRREGLRSLRSGDFRVAAVHLENHLKKVPDDASTRMLLADTYREHKRYDEAIGHYQLLIGSPDHRDTALRTISAIAIMQKSTMSRKTA